MGADSESAHTVTANWNGKRTIFVDYQTRPDSEDDTYRTVYAVQLSGKRLIAAKVTDGEEEGGYPEVAAIGFANADHDPAKEVIVILDWPQRHYDVNGDLLEVRLFDDLKPLNSRLKPLTNLSKHFGMGCDCWDRGATKPRHFKFDNIVSVQKELRRLGY